MGVFANTKLNEDIAMSLLGQLPDEPSAANDDAEAEDDKPNFRPQAKRSERRRSFRRPLGVVATMWRIINGECIHPLAVLILNTSEHGFGMKSPASFLRNELYKLTIGSGDEATNHFIRIVSSRPREDGLFDIGAEAT